MIVMKICWVFLSWTHFAIPLSTSWDTLTLVWLWLVDAWCGFLLFYSKYYSAILLEGPKHHLSSQNMCICVATLSIMNSLLHKTPKQNLIVGLVDWFVFVFVLDIGLPQCKKTSNIISKHMWMCVIKLCWIFPLWTNFAALYETPKYDYSYYCLALPTCFYLFYCVRSCHNLGWLILSQLRLVKLWMLVFAWP